jgi:hypothetical protein
VEEVGDEDTERMVSEYAPSQELVIVLLKRDNRTSTYRIARNPTPREQALHNEVVPSNADDSEAELEVPDLETLIEWEAEGGCEAACPHGCWVEPDGTCPHGNPSWLLRLRLI